MPPNAAAAAPSRNAVSELASHRDYLLRFARRRLADPALAEDAVQDVFEAVIAGRAAFAGRAALRSWLTAVLKHKIVDVIRRSPLHESLDARDDVDGGGSPEPACPRLQPDEVAELRQRLARTLDRIEALPSSLREAVRLRVLEQRDSREVCTALGISEDNLFVRLHRARRQLLAH